MDKELIIEKIVEMLCNYTIEEQEKIMKEAMVELKNNWDENNSNGWAEYSFGV